MQPRKKQTSYFSTVILLAIVLTVGFFILQDWRQSSDTISGSIDVIPGTETESQQPATVERIPLETSEPDRITIPDRDIQAPVQYVGETTEEVYQEALTRGVVHFPGTAKPGELGNPYIFGHSSDYFWKPGDYKEAFRELVDIPLDTEIRITNEDGELFVYRVIETKIVGPKEVSVLDQYNNERYLLTLQTSYPIGTALKRYIVIAEMDEVATFGVED